MAHKTYAADWADRQLTLHRDNLGQYDGDVELYNQEIYGSGGGFEVHPPIIAGWGYTSGGSYVAWAYWTTSSNRAMFQPIGFPDGPGAEAWGWFRFGSQPKPMSEYLTGRYQDPIHYAPKDTVTIEPVSECWDTPGEFVPWPSEQCNPAWSSYALSPAGLFNAAVFSDHDQDGVYWKEPWELPAGYKVPSFGQVKYPTLKTHILEHHWLQNAKVPCNANFTGCEPYYFNHSYQSMPVTLFYDSSIRLMSTLEALSSDRRHQRQHPDGVGLWTRDTSFGTNGDLHDDAYDFAETSYHTLTTKGVRGRDTLGRE